MLKKSFPNYLLTDHTKIINNSVSSPFNINKDQMFSSKNLDNTLYATHSLKEVEKEKKYVSQSFKPKKLPSMKRESIENTTIKYQKAYHYLKREDSDFFLFAASARDVYESLEQLAIITEDLEKDERKFVPKKILPSLQTSTYAAKPVIKKNSFENANNENTNNVVKINDKKQLVDLNNEKSKKNKKIKKVTKRGLHRSMENIFQQEVHPNQKLYTNTE